jgi:hypothetical protein
LAPIALAFFTIGILALILSYGIWKGLGWAWLMSLILATCALVVGGFGALIGALASALPTAIYGLIIIFLGLYPVRMFCARTYIPGTFIFPPVPVTPTAAYVPPVAPAGHCTVPGFSSRTLGAHHLVNNSLVGEAQAHAQRVVRHSRWTRAFAPCAACGSGKHLEHAHSCDIRMRITV